MARIHELLEQVKDPILRKRLEDEVANLLRNKKFGLVFEDHDVERTPLYGISVRSGMPVVRKSGRIDEVWDVLHVEDGKATCRRTTTGEMGTFSIDEIVPVAQLGDPIFPMLQPIDKIENAPGSDLWHTLIEADNYHAIQLLEYLYAGKVDCIYIDPPYNNGAADWKYNDSYVEKKDAFFHSKWLSMLKRRLSIAKRLLTPDGKIAISISHHEVNHLVLLLEEMFSEKQVVVVTVQTSGGKPSGGFNYLHEYIVFVVPKDFKPGSLSFNGGKDRTPFEGLTLATFNQSQRPNQTYPIFVDKANGRIVGCGKSLAERIEDGSFDGDKMDFEYDFSEAPTGCIAVWPITSKGKKCVWRLIPPRLMDDWRKGYIKVIHNRSKSNPNMFSIQYLPDGIIQKIKLGKLEIQGTEDGVPTLRFGENFTEGTDIPTIWLEKDFFTNKGTAQIRDLFGATDSRFPYPKPLHLITEVIRACSDDDDLILDFFAGSGTTLHAVNLLNTEGSGHRRCILVTNNEVNDPNDRKRLTTQGYQSGDPEWEQYGIARYVTWPRTCCTIRGENIKGEPLKGTYLGTEREMSEGFPANVEYFKLGFLERNRVSLGMQFREILPLLWMKSGAVGKRPVLPDGDELPEMMILPENGFAVLLEDDSFARFQKALQDTDGIHTVYFVTDSDDAFSEMSTSINVKQTYQLYRNYIENFALGGRR